MTWTVRIGSFLRDLNDGIHAEIRIEQRVYRYRSAFSGQANQRSAFERMRSILPHTYETSCSAKMIVRQAKMPHSTDV